MKTLRSVTAASLVLLAAWQAAAENVRLVAATRTPHFLIRHDPELKPTAVVIGQDCEYWLAEIGRRLDLPDRPGPPIPVLLYRNQGEFRRATGHDRPGEVLGRASSRGLVELDASGIFAPAEQIAGHEITHVVIFRILGPRSDVLPLWVNEGTAKFMTEDWDELDSTALANAITEGTLIPLSSLARTFPPDERETLAYAESSSAVTFFVRRYGERALVRLIHATARTGSFESAMREVTGGSASEFERRWLVSLQGRYGSPRIMRLVGIAGLLAMPLIAIAAYLALRRRRRRIIQQYDLEEWEEANWRDWGGG
jgi:hypothetical protein